MAPSTSLNSSSVKSAPAARAWTRRIARVLGACLLAWGWAAEAHEPSYADGAPGSPTISPLVTIPGVEITPAPLALAMGDYAAATEEAPPKREWKRKPVSTTTEQQQPVIVRRRWQREPMGWFTMRGGFFDGEGAPENDFVLGGKFTGNVAPYLRMGVSWDWQHHSTDILAPGGSPGSQVVLAEQDSDLFPLLGVIEFHMPTETVRPYFGFGAGWEWLNVDVNDYANGVYYDDDFDGFGWQAYGGLNFRLARNLEIGGEAFWNQAELDRDIYYYDINAVVHEEIDVDGVGFRGGLSFGF